MTTRLLAVSEKRIWAFGTECLRTLLCISYLEHKTNDRVRSRIKYFQVGLQEPLLATVKKRKLAWVGHATRHDSLSETIPQLRHHGRQKKCLVEQRQSVDVPTHAELLIMACREDVKKISAESSVKSPRRPNRSRERTEMNRNIANCSKRDVNKEA